MGHITHLNSIIYFKLSFIESYTNSVDKEVIAQYVSSMTQGWGASGVCIIIQIENYVICQDINY